MAIALDTTVNGGLSTSTSLTWSHTCTGSNLILIVSINGPVSSTDDVSGITYNSVALTKIRSQQIPSDRLVSLWYLIAPATGAHNIVASFTGTYCAGISASYTGVRQSVQPDSSAVGTTSSGSGLTISTITATDNTWLVGGFGDASGGVVSAGANTVVRQSVTAEGNSYGDSNSAQTPAGSHSLAVTGPTTNWGGVVASIAVLGAPVPSTGNFLFLF